MPRDLCRDKHNRASFSNNLNIEFSILGKMREFRKVGRETERWKIGGALKMGISIPPVRASTPTPFQISAEIKIIFTRRRGRRKRRSIRATFPLCTHDARDESSTLSRDGIRWVRKPFEKESSGYRGGGASKMVVCSLPLRGRTSNLRFESPRGVHKSCVLGFRGSGN